MKINNNSTIQMFSLFIDKYNGQEEEYIVGRKETGEYINVPRVAIESIDLLNQRLTIGEVESKLSAKYKEEIGVLEFVNTCFEIGFINKVDGTEVTSINEKQVIKNQFSFIKPKVAKVFFNIYAWFFYIALFIYSMVLYIASPKSLPKITDFLFHDSLTIVVTFGLLSMWGIIFIHEIGHLIAARAHSIESKVKFGRSGMYLVIETVIPNIWAATKKARNEIFLAGLAFNSLMLSSSLTIVYLHDIGIINYSEELYRFVRFIVIINIWSFITQPLIFTKSDLYYVLNNQWNCTDLHGYTALYTKKKFGFHLISDDIEKLKNISKQENISIKKYLPIYLLGLIFSFTVAIVYSGLTYWYFTLSKGILFDGKVLTLQFWDRFFGVGYLITPFIWLFVYIVIDFIKERKENLFSKRRELNEGNS
ncbi:hypothetical protein [Paenisporosarcina sp.]|uniref:hypothetical protein n=1 Tax=Paenisporosarcina sp. TaxID=1932001 RepID=UPI003C75539F